MFINVCKSDKKNPPLSKQLLTFCKVVGRGGYSFSLSRNIFFTTLIPGIIRDKTHF
jgi:hypothetical protein